MRLGFGGLNTVEAWMAGSITMGRDLRTRLRDGELDLLEEDECARVRVRVRGRGTGTGTEAEDLECEELRVDFMMS